MKDLPWDTMVAAGLLAVALAGVWSWQQGLHRQSSAPAAEPWQHVRERYPMPAPSNASAELPEPLLRSVIRANPFSPTRRPEAQKPGEDSGALSGPSTPPPPPQFIFKGRILMGTKQRAVLEEAASRKTHFLQVGQEVAGFKVLDIAENQVVLSVPNSQEPLRIKKEMSSSSKPGTRAP